MVCYRFLTPLVRSIFARSFECACLLLKVLCFGAMLTRFLYDTACFSLLQMVEGLISNGFILNVDSSPTQVSVELECYMYIYVC